MCCSLANCWRTAQGCCEALVGLAQPSSRRRDAGRSLAGLTLVKQWRYGRNQILLFNIPVASWDAELRPADFDLILTDDFPDLRLDRRSGRWYNAASGLPTQVTRTVATRLD